MLDIWSFAAIAAKVFLYAGALGAVGLVITRTAFPLATAPLGKKIKTQTLLLAILVLVASALGFVLRGAALTGGSDGITDPEILGLLWQTPVGTALLFRITGAVFLMTGLFLPQIGQWISLAGGVVVLSSFAQIGHLHDMTNPIMPAVLLVHLLGLSFWVGILAPLHHLSRRPEYLQQAAQLGHQFGRSAMILVPALLLAGLLLAWKLVGSLNALIGSGYGQTLALKICLVASLLGLAAGNKLRLVPAMLAGEVTAARHLRRAIEIETALMLFVLVTTATLTTLLSVPSGG